jgi:serine/threonine-protein kinase
MVVQGTRLGPYEILSLLGAGGMGHVYRARDPRLGREVAIKTIAPHLAAEPDALARFQREARAIAALSHPNILAIHDLGSQGDVWFLVTELLEGETLRGRVSRTTLPWRTAVDIAVAVAEGLAGAHARGIVHRDIKPENIFLTSDRRIKILDFGLARQASVLGDTVETGSPTLSGSTEPGRVVGTVGYMSPEQVQGRPSDARSDIFSLGCVVHEMLSGRRLFHKETNAETLVAILKDTPRALSECGAAVPAELEHVVLHCLEKDRDHRFQSARDLAFALKASLGKTSPTAGSTDRPSLPSVAVLPFLNLSADPENAFFADGVTEDVIAHLSKIRSLKVISRTSVMSFQKRDRSLREIGSILGTATILEGSVRRVGTRVRIVAQLIDAATDTHLWAETYDRELTDIFAIQTDVALQIAAALRAGLSSDERTRIRRPPTHDLQAYRLYLRGRHCSNRYTQEAVREGITYFEQAIASDPAFALAYVGLARAYAELPNEGFLALKPEVALGRAQEAIARAIALDDELGDAHGIVALLSFVRDFDWVGAETEFQLALELSPGSADIYDHYGWMCASLERYDDAIRLSQRAWELDPLAHRTDLASVLLRAGRREEALALATRTIESEPGYARGHATAGWAQLMLGQHAEGVAALERAVAVSPGSTLFLGQLGQAYAMTGKEERARDVLQNLHDLAQRGYVSPYHFAYVHTGLGEEDQAIDWLERAYEERSGAIYGIKGSFLFTRLRSHPRFKALLDKMNLV